MTRISSSESDTGVPVGQLQTDTFCEGCGYNLHAQIITRDERLNLLVCRCPECGRFAAAGQGTTIGRVWLNRFGTFLLVVWVMFLFFGFGLATLFMGILPYSHLRNFTHYEQVSERPPMRVTRYTATSHYYYAVGSGRQLDADALRGEWVELFFTIAAAGVLAFLVGVVHSVFFWHVKNETRMLALVFPLIAFLGASTCWWLDSLSRFLHGWGMARLGGYLLLEWLCVVAGLMAGRPITRRLMRWFIPPKPRQHLAFLWTTDGLKPPL